MWFLRRRATISSGRSIRKRTVFSARGATSARTWRMSTWSPGTWIMWGRRVHEMITSSSLKRNTSHALQEKPLLLFDGCVSLLLLFSPGSSSQRRIRMTAWPSLCRARPLSCRRSCPRHLSPRSFQMIWIWGCRSLPIPTVKCRGPALLWWDFQIVGYGCAATVLLQTEVFPQRGPLLFQGEVAASSIISSSSKGKKC